MPSWYFFSTTVISMPCFAFSIGSINILYFIVLRFLPQHFEFTATLFYGILLSYPALNNKQKMTRGSYLYQEQVRGDEGMMVKVGYSKAWL